MNKRALIISVGFHAFCLVLISSGLSFKLKPKDISISASLVFKNKKKDKDLLPKKPKEAQKKEQALKEPEKKPEVKSQDLAKALPAVPIKAEKLPTKEEKPAKKDNFADTLAALSRNFAKDIKDEALEAEDGDDDYFSQIYSLLKSSFVVPPHLNGPKGEKLQVVLRIYVAPNGSIKKLDLETSSGDDHFDKAVMDGARRVNNFGPVPIFLQDTLKERGLVVELCPFKCLNSR
jgi:TonB family protein